MGEIIDKAKGKIKQAAGKATGNEELEIEGHADELKGKGKGAVEDVKQGVKNAAADIKQGAKNVAADVKQAGKHAGKDADR
jgi:uncharacterized protein YjbJ (UPF0337 family)